MAIPDFGVTADNVRTKFFPAMPAFGAATRPTSTAAAEMVADAGAEVAAALHTAGLDYAAIDDDAGTTYPVSYARCANQVRLLAAIQVQTAYSGADAVSKEWLERAAAWFAMLTKQGSAAMPDGPALAEQPLGPRTHIRHWNLDTGDSTAPSELDDRFRRDDVL